MSVKETTRRQYARLVDRAADQLKGLQSPREGWIGGLRNALGMSGAQLARRVGVTRAAIYQAERKEALGAITLRQLEKVADAMGGRLVYAIVPRGSSEELIRARATEKAERVVRRASAHMALESQALSMERNQQEIEALTAELVRSMPSDLWDDDDV